MAIDVGPACINRDNVTVNALRTYVAEENPANANGTIDAVCIYPGFGGMEGVEVAAFAEDGSDNLTTNGAASFGNISNRPTNFSAPGDFTAFNIATGEYIGIKYTGGQLERVSDGAAGYWFAAADYIPCTAQAFSYATPRTISLYCTGTESGGANAPTAALQGPLFGPMGGPT